MGNSKLPLGGFQQGHCAGAAVYRLTLNRLHHSTNAVRLSWAVNGQPALLSDKTPKQLSRVAVIADIISNVVIPRYLTRSKRGCLYRRLVIGADTY